MKAEYVLASVKVNVIIPENQIIAIIELLAACNVDLAQVQAGSDQLPEALPCDVGATHVNTLQVLQLFSETHYTSILQITTAKETDFAKELTLMKFSNSSVGNLPAF